VREKWSFAAEPRVRAEIMTAGTQKRKSEIEPVRPTPSGAATTPRTPVAMDATANGNGERGTSTFFQRVFKSISPLFKRRKQADTPETPGSNESPTSYLARFKVASMSPFKSKDARFRENLDEEGKAKYDVIMKGASRYRRSLRSQGGGRGRASKEFNPALSEMYRTTRESLIKANKISELGSPKIGEMFFGTRVTNSNATGWLMWPPICTSATMTKRLLIALKFDPSQVAAPGAGTARALNFNGNGGGDAEATLVVAVHDHEVRPSEASIEVEDGTEFTQDDDNRVRVLFGEERVKKLKVGCYFHHSWIYDDSSRTNGLTSRMRQLVASVRGGDLMLTPLVCVRNPPIPLLDEEPEFRPWLDETGVLAVSANERRLGILMPIDLVGPASIVDVARAFGALPGERFDYNANNAFKSCLCQTAAFGVLIGAVKSTGLSSEARRERIVQAAAHLLDARVSWVHKVPIAGRVSRKYVNVAIGEYINTSRYAQVLDSRHIGRNGQLIELLKSTVLYIGDPTERIRGSPVLELTEELKSGDSREAVVVNHSSGLSHVLVYVQYNDLDECNQTWIESNLQPESAEVWRENGGRILALFAVRAEVVDPNVENGEHQYSLVQKLAKCDPTSVSIDELEKMAIEVMRYTWNATDSAIASNDGFGENKGKIFAATPGANSSGNVVIESSMHDFLWRAFELKNFQDVAFTPDELKTLPGDEIKLLDELALKSWQDIIKLVQTGGGRDEAEIDDEIKERLALRIRSAISCNRWPTIKFAQLLALTFGVKVTVKDLNDLTEQFAGNASCLTIASVISIARRYKTLTGDAHSNTPLRERLGERHAEWCEFARRQNGGERLVALLDATQDRERDQAEPKRLQYAFRRALNLEACSEGCVNAGQFAMIKHVLPRKSPTAKDMRKAISVHDQLFSNVARVNTVVRLACSLAFYNKTLSVGARPRRGLSERPLERDVHDFIHDDVYGGHERLQEKFKKKMAQFFASLRT